MNRRNFLRAAAAVPLVAGAAPLSFSSIASTRSADGTNLPSTSSAPMHERYLVSLERALTGTSPAYTQEFLLADVRPVPERRFTEYSGDLSGRYIGALATSARVYHSNFPQLDSLVERVVALQKADGYFGSNFHYDKPTDQDLALLWGNGRLLVGLLEYYRYKPSAPVLAACRRLGDFLLHIAPLMLSRPIRDEFGAAHFASSYICWTQQTEGLANLYRVTRDARYRTLAEDIAAVIERRPGDHVHGYLSSLRGVMDLYESTSDARLLRQCETAWQEVAQSQDLLITGGVPEGWSPNKHRTEGCAEADWLRLSLSLWKATANPKYLSMAERTMFNEFAFNQFATGDFGHRMLSETGFLVEGGARAWWCCTLHGLRCFPDVQSSAFHWQDGALYYDLPIDSQSSFTAGPANTTPTEAHRNLSASVASSLAQKGSVSIAITSADDSPASLCIRKPEWSDGLQIRINKQVSQSPVEGGYVRLHRRWERGDVVSVQYAMLLRPEPANQKRVSYSYGPWLLGAAASDNPAYFNELTTENKLSGAPVLIPPAAARPFSVPVAATAFHYTPAEFHDQTQTVTLRAIAEQTGQPTTSWELRFLIEDQS